MARNTGKCGAREPPHALPSGRWHPGVGQESTESQPSPAEPQRALCWVFSVGFQGGTRGDSAASLGAGDPGGAGARAPPSSDPGFSAFNPRGRALRPLGSAERASGQCGAGGERVQSQGRRQFAGMAPAAASGGSTLPSGFSVFASFPDLLFVCEFVSDTPPCSGKGMGRVELLGSSAPLSQSHQQHGGNQNRESFPHLW